MKKLLTILSAVGLTAMTATSVVACSTTNVQQQNNGALPNHNNSVDEGNDLSQYKNQINLLKAQEKELQNQLDNTNNQLKSSQQALANAIANGKEANGVIKQLSDQVDSLNKTKKEQEEQISKLQDQINNPLIVTTVTQTSSTDFKNFDIKLSNSKAVNTDQVDATNVQLLINYPTSGQAPVAVSTATISGDVMHVTLSNALEVPYDYDYPQGYDIQFNLKQNMNGIFQGNTQTLHIQSKSSTSFAYATNTDVAWNDTNTVVTIKLDENATSSLNKDELDNPGLFTITPFGSFGKDITVTKASITNGSLVLTLSDAMPTSGVSANYASGWMLSLINPNSKGLDGIANGLTIYFSLPSAPAKASN